MDSKKILNYIENVVNNIPKDWLKLTTHRLDIYNEKLAKSQFLEEFDSLFKKNNATESTLNELPTAYDYIRLGHPLSCVLEWTVANLYALSPENVISFSSKTAPVLAVLRKNLMESKKTQIIYKDELPALFNEEVIKNVYGYDFELKKINSPEDIAPFEGSQIFLSQKENICNFDLSQDLDFYINIHPLLGSIVLINGEQNKSYISEIQHVRRRETIAMTPANCFSILKNPLGNISFDNNSKDSQNDKEKVLENIANITGTTTKALVASSGLSMQYGIMMGLIHDALENHQGKAIKFIVPPNCYGGTNDQARRVATCMDNVQIMDLPVDGGHDMVESIDTLLNTIADDDAVPYIIAEIPTNPRVEVPDLEKLKNVLNKERKTRNGAIATKPVFILDQTFCPNTPFLGENDILSSTRTISYVSGSKFPSGGRCTAGYCVANNNAANLMNKIELHLKLCDNEATDYQLQILAEQLPSMNQRIAAAYKNTREFVNFIAETLPDAKINFVSEELAELGFTPSVFSLDLPTKGNTEEEREAYKRALNNKLIDLMITEIPNESKFCVSYGQLKGCYWTIPATSTQGTTKEGDKDYIARVALSPDMNLDRHKEVFLRFCKNI